MSPYFKVGKLYRYLDVVILVLANKGPLQGVMAYDDEIVDYITHNGNVIEDRVLTPSLWTPLG